MNYLANWLQGYAKPKKLSYTKNIYDIPLDSFEYTIRQDEIEQKKLFDLLEERQRKKDTKLKRTKVQDKALLQAHIKKKMAPNTFGGYFTPNKLGYTAYAVNTGLKLYDRLRGYGGQKKRKTYNGRRFIYNIQRPMRQKRRYRRKRPMAQEPLNVVETKIVDITLGSGPSHFYNDTTKIRAYSDTTNIWALNLLTTGTAEYQRIGKKVRWHDLNIQIEFSNNWLKSTQTLDLPTLVKYNMTLRYFIIHDSVPSDTVPRFDELFNTTDPEGTVTSEWDDPQNSDTLQRFTILYDSKCTIDPIPYFSGAAAWTGLGVNSVWYMPGFTKSISKTINIPLNFDTVYKSTSNPPQLSDISTGALYFGYTSNVPEGAFDTEHGACRAHWHATLRYND